MIAADLANKIGSVASVLTVMAFLPQAWKIWRQGDANAISLRTYLLLVSASGLWAWFGYVIQSVPVIVTNSICLVVQASILVLKLLSRR
ncbi:glutathione synthetase [Cyanobium sp. HWJ4-Hawea]|uniref:SemiSWEET family sugar transporter n=1 Tax=Cyanobium sp. HWJ4-Hawea TaxID=2823713 RepID=UPI0020CE138F|nr:SemiSWEET family transporter [Cyanobium sp. HWJ4-Hawea]MCP9808633.1 glutathione synthetase [Cyanobium sp. HWJ4-Hawea]